ncbi:uncharacterized protein J8A68_001173 [[Candida] subhashii]|uniref:Uncharacterized protein n=1 Tax=[Candida] subhashii TaxID=561895 RepID=A0A8J5US55_9ASCO|nr:uncharacterized protein J8A68_001173 [[Candida] subhashii]KAG7665117.1 hypothetical protein J8A68_001173 [[Candida] subhashii]
MNNNTNIIKEIPFIDNDKFDFTTTNSINNDLNTSNRSIFHKFRKRTKTRLPSHFHPPLLNGILINDIPPPPVTEQVSITKVSKFHKFVTRMKSFKSIKKHQTSTTSTNQLPKPKKIRRTVSTPRIPTSSKTLNHARLSYSSLGKKWDRLFRTARPININNNNMNINSPFFPISPQSMIIPRHVSEDMEEEEGIFSHINNSRQDISDDQNKTVVEENKDQNHWFKTSRIVNNTEKHQHRSSSLLSFWNGSFFNDGAVRNVKLYSQSQITDQSTITSIQV